MDPELEFISGRIFDLELPKNKQYLWKYFKTTLQKQFVKYYLTYRTYKKFTEHTGYYCSNRWIRRLIKNLDRLEQLHAEAKEAALQGDFEKLATVESGKLRHFRQKRAPRKKANPD